MGDRGVVPHIEFTEGRVFDLESGEEVDEPEVAEVVRGIFGKAIEAAGGTHAGPEEA